MLLMFFVVFKKRPFQKRTVSPYMGCFIFTKPYCLCSDIVNLTVHLLPQHVSKKGSIKSKTLGD